MNANRKNMLHRVLVALATVTMLLGPWAISHTWADEPAAPATGKQLTVESLGAMLEGLGYEPKRVTLPSGHVLQTLTIPQEGWSFYFELSLSFDGSRVWFVAPLGTVESPEKLPQPIALKMLEENFNIQPMAFTYVPSAKKIDLIRTLENKDVTPAKLRTTLEAMLPVIRRTEPLWNPVRWASESPAAE